MKEPYTRATAPSLPKVFKATAPGPCSYLRDNNAKSYRTHHFGVGGASSAAVAYAQGNPLPKSGETLVRYGEDIEGWTVHANKTRRDCLIVSSFGPGSVQMGVAKNRAVGYLGVFTKLDIGVKDGVKQIFVDIDGHFYAGVMTTAGQLADGYSGGYIMMDDPAFKRDVAKKYTMTVFPQTQAAFDVDLRGTYKAMAAGRKCLSEQKPS